MFRHVNWSVFKKIYYSKVIDIINYKSWRKKILNETKKKKYATTSLLSNFKWERKEAQEIIYKTLKEIIKEEKNHEVGALSHIQQIQMVQISFNTRFYFGIAFVSGSDWFKWCCGICQTKRRTWWSKIYFGFLLIPNWKCLLWFVLIWTASLDQKQLKESLWISNASWKLIMEDYHSPQHRLDLPLEMKYHLDQVFWE